MHTKETEHTAVSSLKMQPTRGMDKEGFLHTTEYCLAA